MSEALKLSSEDKKNKEGNKDLINFDAGLQDNEKMDIENKISLARENIRKILGYFGVFNYEEDINLEGNLLKIELKGDNLEFLTQDEGKVLSALQYLVVLITNNVFENHIKIVLDCCGFRERRNKEIKKIVKDLVKVVRKSKIEAKLEPMNPYERRLVHSYVSTFDGVYSRSIGNDPGRSVVIYPGEKENFAEDKNFFEMD